MIYKEIIYIHIPKTGGSSIRNSLNENYEFIYNASKKNFKKMGLETSNEKFENYNFSFTSFKDHLPYQLIKKTNLNENKFKFTFIRNPFSRMVSLYFECLGNISHLEGLGIKSNITFDNFIDVVVKKPYWFSIPMIDYIGSENLKDIDFIGKFENFDDDIISLKKKIKISIKHHNFNSLIKSKFKFSDYRVFYKKKQNIEKVYNLYNKDFEKFNYNYENFLIFEKNKIRLINILSKIFKRKISNLLK